MFTWAEVVAGGLKDIKEVGRNFSKSCPGLSAPFSQYLQVISSLVWCHKGGYVWAFSLFFKLQGTNYISFLRNNSFSNVCDIKGWNIESLQFPSSMFHPWSIELLPGMPRWVGSLLRASLSCLSLSLSLSRAADALHTNLHPRRPQ